MDNQSQSGHVMTLANSIIGVSVLAMPYCFKQCGILLSIIMLLISSIISRLACHFLLKSAIIARRKTFEFLAFYIFGSLGKFAIEIGMIGFLLGTCIAFFVVMGDLAPEIVSEVTGAKSGSTMRTSILMALALFCVLPLGLLRNVDSLNGVSKATIGFYCCLVLKIIIEALPHIFTGDWITRVNFWRPAGILQCLPIFSMALFCQTQLFEIYQAVPNATLEKMNDVIRIAVNICTWVYIFVGMFGYIAFAPHQLTGNILLNFSPSLLTSILKFGFILSVAFSFPLVIFPCRASLYSLLFREGHGPHDGITNYIPEGKFKGLTFLIVFVSLIIGILIPNIELVLGLVGSTIGVMICVLFPVTCFICISPKNTNERILAQIMLFIGIMVMVLGTYENIRTYEKETVAITEKILSKILHNDIKVLDKVPISSIDFKQSKVDKNNLKISPTLKEVRHEPPQPEEPVVPNKIAKEKTQNDLPDVKLNNLEVNEVRREPPQPEEPIEKPEEPQEVIKQLKVEETSKKEQPSNINMDIGESQQDKLQKSKNDEIIDVEAIKKEESELKNQQKEQNSNKDANQALIDTIQKQNEVQQELVEQQKKLIGLIEQHQHQENAGEAGKRDKVEQERLEAVKQIKNIALKAIEKLEKLDKKEEVPKNDSGIHIEKKSKVDPPKSTVLKEKLEAGKNEKNVLIQENNFEIQNKNIKHKNLENINNEQEIQKDDLKTFKNNTESNENKFILKKQTLNLNKIHTSENFKQKTANLGEPLSYKLGLNLINSSVNTSSNNKLKNVPLPLAIINNYNKMNFNKSSNVELKENLNKLNKKQEKNTSEPIVNNVVNEESNVKAKDEN